ncbi:BON domain-containing protein [candidate division KSB1 bacterium]|nr:BON domain-containing protein [candidate division KSB1 bacterium]
MKKLLIVLFSFLIFSPALTETAKNPDMLKENVMQAINNRYSDDISVNVSSEGEVTLEGRVDTYWDKLNIYGTVSHVKGVRMISNQIAINTENIPDDMIEQNIEQTIRLNEMILEPDDIKVNVDGGMVVLGGTVSFEKEKQAARDVAAWHEGVRSVRNDIEVLPPKKAKSDENLKEVLNSIMENQFSREDQVKFTIDDGMVTLKGKTNTLWAKDEIADQFREVRGIKKVDNNLDVAMIW